MVRQDFPTPPPPTTTSLYSRRNWAGESQRLVSHAGAEGGRGRWETVQARTILGKRAVGTAAPSWGGRVGGGASTLEAILREPKQAEADQRESRVEPKGESQLEQG